MAQRLATYAAPPSLDPIRAVDPEVAELIAAEQHRQESHLELIASENFVHPAILAAQGCVMTNKYAEGYPGRRYYGGCDFVDGTEALAIERAKTLFGADHANVQPHSGAQANMAAYLAVLQPGATIMGMNLSHGGHLTHGSPVNFSGRLFRVVPYGVRRDTERVDFDEARTLARAEHPKLIVVGGSAYPRHLDFASFRAIADEVGALLMVDMAHFAGLVAAKLHPDPVPYSDIVTSTTHKTLRGPRAGLILCREQHAKAIDSSVFPGIQGGPLEHVIAAKAICFHLAATPEFRAYQEQIVRNARAMADELAGRGFRIVSGGTDTHLLLADVTERGLTGRDAEEALGRVRITVNKNTIPFDPRKPFNPSGIRIGTPAVTTRGMGEAEMRQIAALIDRVLAQPGDEAVQERARADVAALCDAFPLYGG